jgi:hypothetical protein
MDTIFGALVIYSLGVLIGIKMGSRPKNKKKFKYGLNYETNSKAEYETFVAKIAGNDPDMESFFRKVNPNKEEE